MHNSLNRYLDYDLINIMQIAFLLTGKEPIDLNREAQVKVDPLHGVLQDHLNLTQVFKLTIISINLIAFVLSYICLLMHQDRLNLSN